MAFGYIMLLVILIMPLMMVGFGLLLMKNPPKKNSYYGYRTRRSVRSQETWDFAHYYFGKLWLVCGLVSLPISLVPLCLVLGKSEQVISVAGLIVLGIQTLLLLVTILLTERALMKNFDEFGKPL